METLHRATNIQRDELVEISRIMLRAQNVELGDDPATELQVAVRLGYLTLDPAIAEQFNVQLPNPRAGV